tara:strand:- start:386 stop:1327 length:942 start_codon:yes stop_codon:yes gene_type:complete
MNFIRSFLIILFLAPASLLCHENDVDSLINKSIIFLKTNQNDSLDLTLKSLVPKVVGKELDSLLILRQKSLVNQVAKTNIIKSKSQLQSLILLLICLGGFIYMIYYTDQKNREKQVKKIRAAKGISKYEYDLRKKISERLHDDIGGSIIALKMRCSDKKGMANEVKLLDDIYNSVRSLSSDLDIQHKFSQTIENGIDILVDEMCHSFKKTTINVFPQSINEIDDQDLIQDIIMTVKELITNVIKHSKADEISINVSFDNNTLTILVEDNGKGINNIEFGHGLTAINNRAILREGSLDLDSNKKGTSTTVEFKI